MENKTLTKIVVLVMLAVMPGVEIQAQDWKSILKGVAESVGQKVSDKLSEKVETINLEGTWTYVKPDCKFQSESLLSKAGGEVASNKIEGKMTELLDKIGIDQNAVFTFKSDSTYTLNNGKREMAGTYSINNETKEITLTSRMKMNFTAKIQYNVLTPHKMSLLFKANKLMSFVQNVSGALARRSSNKTINAANTLLNQYDGLMLGVEFEDPSRAPKKK